MLMYCIDCGYKEDRVRFLRDEEHIGEWRCPGCGGINCLPESEVSWCDNCGEFPVAREGLWCKNCILQYSDPERFIVS